MIDKKSQSICVIPARGGSKGVLNKNIVDVLGSPLISFSIKSAIESDLFDRVIVSTDSKEIAEVSISYGADVPFIRPPELSTDDSLVEDTFVHCLKFIEKNFKEYPYVCLRQATTPLVSKEDLIKSVVLFNEKNADMVVSVSKTPCNINWVGNIGKDLSMKNFNIMPIIF